MKIKTVKQLFAALTLITITSASLAQTGSSSLYSRFGIGEIDGLAQGQSLSLGGTGIGLRTPYEINPLNPASYSAFYPAQNLTENKSLGQVKYPNFMFQAGVRARRILAQTPSSEQDNFDYGLRSFAIGFHVNKYWSASVGLLPYSSIGYQVNTEDELFSGNVDISIKSIYTGMGGLSRAYFGNSLKYKQISAGVNINYIFGNQSQIAITQTTDANYSSIVTSNKTVDIRGLMFDFGTQFSDTIADKFIYTVGAVYTGATNLNAYQTNVVKQEYQLNGLSVNKYIINDTVSNGNYTLPQMYGVGISVRNEKWLFAADYKRENWEDALFLGNSKKELSNSTTYSFGTEYIPNINSDFFFSQVNYRMGVRYSDYYLNFEGTQVTDKAVSFGVGIPITSKKPGLRTPFRINIGFEAGQKGALTEVMIMENYYLINLSFNMGSIWFIKKQFR